MLTKYRAYKSESESCIMVTVAGKEDKLRQQNMFAADNVLLWEIDVHTYEEMMAIYNLRCCFGLYNPWVSLKIAPDAQPIITLKVLTIAGVAAKFAEK